MMNPYAFTNLINPATRPDWREAELGIHNTGLNYSLSRAFYRLVQAVGSWRFSRKR